MEHGAKLITLHWETNALYTMLQIADDGEGIEKKDLPHIFERFYRTKDSKEDSLGLGLAFAKSIICLLYTSPHKDRAVAERSLDIDFLI